MILITIVPYNGKKATDLFLLMTLCDIMCIIHGYVT